MLRLSIFIVTGVKSLVVMVACEIVAAIVASAPCYPRLRFNFSTLSALQIIVLYCIVNVLVDDRNEILGCYNWLGACPPPPRILVGLAAVYFAA